MNKKKVLIGSFIGLSAIFTGITLSMGKKVYDGTFGAKPRVSSEEMESHYLQNASDALEKLKEYPHQKFLVESEKNGYHIETLHIKSKKESKNVMILVHGIKSNYYELLNVAFRYLDDGYNVILYNQRQTGLTGGKDFTFGLFERIDLEEVAVIAKRLYPEGLIGIHGFSMGAATAAMHVAINEKSKKVNFYILDAPYHTMESTVELALKEKKPPLLPNAYIKWSGDTVLNLKNRVHYKDVEAIKSITQATVPILIMHGTEDKITAPEGSQILFDSITHEKKVLHYFDGSAHCVAHREQEEAYFQVIYNFIHEYIK